MTHDEQTRGGTSASNAAADAVCPGRHLAQRGLPEPPETDDARSGRIIHAALANSNDRGFMEKLTYEQRNLFDQCRDIEKRLVGQYFADMPSLPDGKSQPTVFREQRYWVKLDG